MPIKQGEDKNGKYFQWGDSGYKYRYSSEESKQKAKKKAEEQMKAAFASGYKGGVMNYKCVTVKATDDNPAAKYVEDEESLFVFDENGKFYPADEFFCMVGEVEFTTP